MEPRRPVCPAVMCKDGKSSPDPAKNCKCPDKPSNCATVRCATGRPDPKRNCECAPVDPVVCPEMMCADGKSSPDPAKNCRCPLVDPAPCDEQTKEICPDGKKRRKDERFKPCGYAPCKKEKPQCPKASKLCPGGNKALRFDETTCRGECSKPRCKDPSIDYKTAAKSCRAGVQALTKQWDWRECACISKGPRRPEKCSPEEAKKCGEEGPGVFCVKPKPLDRPDAEEDPDAAPKSRCVKPDTPPPCGVFPGCHPVRAPCVGLKGTCVAEMRDPLTNEQRCPQKTVYCKNYGVSFGVSPDDRCPDSDEAVRDAEETCLQAAKGEDKKAVAKRRFHRHGCRCEEYAGKSDEEHEKDRKKRPFQVKLGMKIKGVSKQEAENRVATLLGPLSQALREAVPGASVTFEQVEEKDGAVVLKLKVVAESEEEGKIIQSKAQDLSSVLPPVVQEEFGTPAATAALEVESAAYLNVPLVVSTDENGDVMEPPQSAACGLAPTSAAVLVVLAAALLN